MSVLPPWARSIRLRLTLLYSGVLFSLAALLVLSLYFGLRLSLQGEQLAQVPGRTGAALVDAQAFERQVNEHALDSLRSYSLAALAILFAASLVVGWVVSGHVLKPINEITRVAREIQATNLSRRIALSGPDDELLRLADTFDAMLDRIGFAFESQQRFLADASHELRNPLGIIRTNAALIASTGSAAPDVRAQASRIDRASERMARLVDDLLALARLESSPTPPQPVDLDRLVVELGEELDPGRAVDWLTGPAGVVDGDELALRRALANLVENAHRHSPAHGKVRVATGRDEAWAWISVSDEGPGVGESDRERIFERFYRSDAGRSRTAGGAGLGLPISRQIARSHGGDIRVVSAAGAGATFVLWLPTQPDPGPVPDGTPRASA